MNPELRLKISCGGAADLAAAIRRMEAIPNLKIETVLTILDSAAAQEASHSICIFFEGGEAIHGFLGVIAAVQVMTK